MDGPKSNLKVWAVHEHCLAPYTTLDVQHTSLHIIRERYPQTVETLRTIYWQEIKLAGS